MDDFLKTLRVATLLMITALSAAACDLHGDAGVTGTGHDAMGAVVGKLGEGAIGADQSVEDSALTTKVSEAIRADPGLQTQQIVVDADDAVVTLSGTVDSPSLRERAVERAGSVDGVAQVQDKLEVRN